MTGPDIDTDERAESARPRTIAMRTDELKAAATPADRRVMPGDFSISLAAKHRADAVINSPGRKAGDGSARLQEMPGYEETFSDIVDFILRCTHRIWEEKAIGYLYEHYGSAITVHHDSGTGYGREPVIAGTTQFIAAFPDLRIMADEIIWCTDGGEGFWTSHRCLLVGHNTGYSQWGPPTGRKIAVRCIADCRSTRNQIVEEFVIYNTASMLIQLGFDVHELARAERARRLAVDPDLGSQHGEAQRILGQGRPHRPLDAPDLPFEIDRFVRASFDEIWNWRLLDRVEASYSPSVLFHGPTDREMYGTGAYKAWVLGLLAMFPDATLVLDSTQWMGNDDEGYLAALRWHFIGTHTGYGFYGPPTGRPISMWGLTHLRVRDARIVEEWWVNNEFEVLVQLAPDPL